MRRTQALPPQHVEVMPQRPIHYASPEFDRLAERRTDPAWLAGQMQNADARIAVLVERKHLMRASAPAYVPMAEWHEIAISIGRDPHDLTLLGAADGQSYFAVDLTRDEASKHATLAAASPVGLRDVVGELPDVDATVLALAGALAHWHRGHGFCPACGAATTVTRAGYVRVCDGCGKQHFPRTDPAVICLVINGDECLLGRRAIWAKERRSTLAGFVEPGETLEQAVAREIFEEVGVHVGKVVYRGSQPWPFPASLMLGFWAEATSTEVNVDNDEIVEAHWFSRARIRSQTASGDLVLPPADSISHRLVTDWLHDENARV